MNRCVHQCCRCINCKRYYIINDCDLEKTNYGYCRIKRETVSTRGSCEFFAYNSNRNYKSNPMIEARLVNILNEISILRRLVEEDEDGKEL